MAQKQKVYELCQTLPQGGVDVLFKFVTEERAYEAAHEINVALTERGIPSSVSCAYVR